MELPGVLITDELILINETLVKDTMFVEDDRYISRFSLMKLNELYPHTSFARFKGPRRHLNSKKQTRTKDFQPSVLENLFGDPNPVVWIREEIFFNNFEDTCGDRFNEYGLCYRTEFVCETYYPPKSKSGTRWTNLEKIFFLKFDCANNAMLAKLLDSRLRIQSIEDYRRLFGTT